MKYFSTKIAAIKGVIADFEKFIEINDRHCINLQHAEYVALEAIHRIATYVSPEEKM